MSGKAEDNIFTQVNTRTTKLLIQQGSKGISEIYAEKKKKIFMAISLKSLKYILSS